MRASNSLARTCSGDIYATVPSVVPGLVRCCTSLVNVCVSGELGEGLTLASPKSRILACPRWVTKMFAGLMSRWTIPLAWAASRPSAMSMPTGAGEDDGAHVAIAVDAIEGGVQLGDQPLAAAR